MNKNINNIVHFVCYQVFVKMQELDSDDYDPDPQINEHIAAIKTALPGAEVEFVNFEDGEEDEEGE